MDLFGYFALLAVSQRYFASLLFFYFFSESKYKLSVYSQVKHSRFGRLLVSTFGSFVFTFCISEPEPQFLLPCTICNKTFNPESLQRHSKICEKNSTKKRKQFDSFKQRVQGTGIAEFLSLAPVRKEKPISPKKKATSWKEKHEAFVSAIRAARCTGK